MTVLTDAIINNLKSIAKQTAWEDDDTFVVYDFSGSNVDDAYQGGYRDGEIYSARKLLSDLGIQWE